MPDIPKRNCNCKPPQSPAALGLSFVRKVPQMPEEIVSPETSAPDPKPATASDKKPDGWEKLRPEGSREGPAEVGYDARTHKAYHVNALGQIQYHETPEGFRYKAGELVPVESK